MLLNIVSRMTSFENLSKVGRTLIISKYDFCSSIINIFKGVRAQKFPRTDFFFNLPSRKVMILPKRPKKWWSPTWYWRQHAPKNTLNLKNRALLADKAAVSVSSKILQLDLSN